LEEKQGSKGMDSSGILLEFNGLLLKNEITIE
jgi:hypothetical protein